MNFSERPKSIIIGVNSLLSTTFFGFISKWHNPLSWQNLIPFNIFLKIKRACLSWKPLAVSM